MKSDSNTTAADDDGHSSPQTMIRVEVGNSVFETTKEELESRDENSYFHARLSGRWSLNNNTLTIPGRSGRIFKHFLFYLEFGDIPREVLTGESLLEKGVLVQLQGEAEFFLLPNLTAICAKELESTSINELEPTSVESTFEEYAEASYAGKSFISSAEERMEAKVESAVAKMEDEKKILEVYLKALEMTREEDMYIEPHIESHSVRTVEHINQNGKREEKEVLVFKLYYQVDLSTGSDISPYNDWFWERYEELDNDSEQNSISNISYWNSVYRE